MSGYVKVASRAAFAVAVASMAAAMLGGYAAPGAYASRQVVTTVRTLKQVTYDHVSLTYDRSVTGTVTGTYVPPYKGDFGRLYPASISFQFYRAGSPRGVMVVFPLTAGNALAGSAKALSAILSAALPLPVNAGLPFEPEGGAAQIIIARAHYFPFKNGSGVAYLTAFAQNTVPVTRGMLSYVFQGITQDKHFYISMLVPVDTAALPRTSSAILNTNDQFHAAMVATARTLGTLPASAFIPSLAALDAVAHSIVANPSFVAPATVTKYVNTAQLGGTGANLRANPDTQSAVLAFIPNGTGVQVALAPVTGADGKAWYKVIYESKTGYVRSDLLSQYVP